MPRIFSANRDRRYYRNLRVFASSVFLVVSLSLYFGLPLLQTYDALHPSRFPVGQVSPADLDLDYVDVTLHTEDGLNLYGWYVPSTNRAAIILVHAFNGNRTGTMYHAALLAKHGYGVLLYDTRTQGESEGDLYALGWEDHLDIFAALDYLRQRPEVDADRIGVLGLSAGAKATLYAAAQTDEIAAVVAEGTRWRTFEDLLIATEPGEYIWIPTEWFSYKYAEVASGIQNPIPLSQVVSQIAPTPMFLIAAGGETATSQAYFDAVDGPKSLWVRDEPGHQIDALFDQPEEYEHRVVGFLDQALLRED
jgi:pimeloyl-ACP methyl ester carboxylesterase